MKIFGFFSITSSLLLNIESFAYVNKIFGYRNLPSIKYRNYKIKMDNTPEKTRQLALDNHKLVPYFAKTYIKKHSLNKDKSRELVQEGYLGFMRACQKYNESGGALSTYSSFWIRRFMTNYIQAMYKHKIVTYDENKLKFQTDKIGDPCEFSELITSYPLSNYEKDIVYKRYVLKEKVKDIAKEYNCSRNTLTHHYNKVKRKIRSIDKVRIIK